MRKTILVTGATDGIGKLTAQMLAKAGHKVLVHGRSAHKVEAVVQEIAGDAQGYTADLSSFLQVEQLGQQVAKGHPALHAIINNAGVLKAPETVTPQGLDLRFVVNTLAPYVLTRRLLGNLVEGGRVINLSSAAQALVDEDALLGRRPLQDMEAYAQSKLAITLWSKELAEELAKELAAPKVVLAVNPGSLLASKMVKEGFGVAGKDLSIGAKILCEAAVDEAFADASGKYYDNDLGRFGEPNPGVFDAGQISLVKRGMTQAIERWKS